MSSPEFAELRGISGTATAARCAILKSPAKRSLLWFIQARSLQPGGLKQLAVELVSMFPDRIVRVPSHWVFGKRGLTPPGHTLSQEEVRAFAVGNAAMDSRAVCSDEREPTLEEYFVGLCIDPTVFINMPGEHGGDDAEDERATLRRFPGIDRRDFEDAGLEYFKDVIGALVEYKRRYAERVKAEFCHTAISREIWKQLDYALATRTMILIDGREGRGKTEAVQAWCNCHLGDARFVSLYGTSTKTTQFRALARALGVGHGYTSKVSEMQAKVEDVVRTSQLMLVIDEAHYFFNQGPRMYTRPEMLDWIDTALCNPPSSVALITTPQFMECMERAAGQVEWNYRQFRRRCKRTVRLPEMNTPEDIESVARRRLPVVDRRTLKEVLGYVAVSKRDLSAVGDVAREAKQIAEQEGSGNVTRDHIFRAIHEVLIPSDTPWAEMEERIRKSKASRKGGQRIAMPAPELRAEEPEAFSRDASRQGSSILPSMGRARISEPTRALVGATD